MEFQTWANKLPKGPGEINEDPSMTEVDGFVPFKTRLLEIMAAGKQLEEARKLKYHYDQDQPLGEMDPEAIADPLTQPGFDPSMVTEAEGVLEQAKHELELLRREKVAAAAEAAEQDPETEEESDRADGSPTNAVEGKQ